MRRLTIPFVTLALVSLVLLLGPTLVEEPNNLPAADFPKDYKQTVDGPEKLARKTRADLALEQEILMTRDPQTGTVPKHKLAEAIRYADQLRNSADYSRAAISGVEWTERGPDNVGGRTRAILIDKNDPTGATVFAAGVAGGLWKTTNIYAAEPDWEPVDDTFDNMAISTIAQHPTNHDTLYFGTGEGFFNSDAVQGNGIWRSTDGGSTWAQLANTVTANFLICSGPGNCDFAFVQKIAVKSDGTVFAATRGTYTNRGGMMRSTDHGANWTRVEDGSASSSRDWCADVEIAANGDIYASFGIGNNDGIWKSTNANNGAVGTWSQVYTSAASEQRIELAVYPGHANYLYAMVEGTSNQLAKIMFSNNGGSSWSTCGSASWQDNCVAGGSDFTRGQAFYDLALAVDPNDSSRVFAGGVDIFLSTDSGDTWTQVSDWADCGTANFIHADHHTFVFKDGNSDTLLLGNDGGVYVSLDASSATPDYTHKDYGYNVTQFYGNAMDPTAHSPYFIAGAQDNGSHLFEGYGVNSTTEVTGGDGAFCHIDQDESTYQWTQYTYNQYYRSTDNWNSSTYVNLSSSLGKFINPTDYDNSANLMYCSYSSGNYLRWNNPQTGSSATAVGAGFTGQVSAVRVDENTANRVWFGTDGGKVYRVDNANGSPSVTDMTGGSMPGSGYVSCIEIQNGNANHLLVTFSNYSVSSVWQSLNGGSTWTDVEGNLPDMPVRWALFNPNDSSEVLLATEVGVWSTDQLNAGSTDWQPSNSGLANCRTDMLQIRTSDSLVMAATHGRGAFTTDVFSGAYADFEADQTVTYIGNTVTFTDGSYRPNSTWSWSFSPATVSYVNSTNSNSQNPEVTFTAAGLYQVTLNIDGGGGDKTQTKSSYIQVLPDVTPPYLVGDGGNFESNAEHFAGVQISGNTQLWERGAPTNFLTTLNSSSNGWKTDLDADITEGDYQCALATPNFDFSTPGVYNLKFRKSMEVNFCNAPFAVQVQYSLDKGTTWTRLGDETTGTNWYNRGSTTCGGCCVNADIFSDRTGWTTTVSNQNTEHDVSSLAGNSNVAFRIVLSVQSGYSATGYTRDGFMVDDFEVEYQPYTVETTATSSTENLGPNETVIFLSGTNKLMAMIENLSSHDYGSTTVAIDRTGTGASEFWNSGSGNHLADKSFTVTPTSNNVSGSYRITLYWENSEVSGWETATSKSWNSDATLAKTGGAVSNITAATPYANGVTNYLGTSATHGTYGSSDNYASAEFATGFSGFGGGDPGNPPPLPIVLTSFDVACDNGRVRARWTTESELNNERFELERSADAEQWELAAAVSGAGTSNELREYEQFTENPDAQNWYYRLRQIDFDGHSTVSDMRMVKCQSQDVSIDVVPNPISNGQFALHSINTSGKIIDAEVVVYAANGTAVLRKRVTLGQAASTVALQLREEVQAGMYYLKVTDSDSNSLLLMEKVLLVE